MKTYLMMKHVVLIILFIFLNFIVKSQKYGIINDLDSITEFKKIDSLIKNKKYIFLGESVHNGYEYSQVKYSLIKYLHEKHNFNTLLFESGMADCFYGNNQKLNHDSTWLIKHSIYPIWWSKPTISLMNYVIKNNLNLGGFDYQSSSSTSSHFLKLLKKIDVKLINETFRNDSIFSNFSSFNQVDSNLNKVVYDSIKVIACNLIKNYNLINEILTKQIAADTTLLYYKKIISNKLFVLSNFNNIKKMYPLRDSVMADNIQWFFDFLYPNQKIIIWGANDHISKERSNFGNYYAGAVLPERIKKESYYIGLYSFSGDLYNFKSGAYKMIKPKRNSLESKLQTFFGEGNNGWIDLQSFSDCKGFKWLNKSTISYALGLYPVKVVPIKCYDGIILINKLSINH